MSLDCDAFYQRIGLVEDRGWHRHRLGRLPWCRYSIHARISPVCDPPRSFSAFFLILRLSNSWSARHSDITSARAAIAKARGVPINHKLVESELSDILLSIEEENSPTSNAGHGAGWLDCFKGFRKGSSRVGYRTLLGMSLQSLQQLTGANYLCVISFGALRSVPSHANS